MKIITITLVLLVWVTSALGNTWSKIRDPTADSTRVIGFYSAGCLAGAIPLPLQGKGFQVMRPSRNRYYGHPRLIALVEELGRHAASWNKRLLIGDLSQPRGGPMAYGHRSHQIGLDVDIWLSLKTDKQFLSPKETETLPMVSVVKAAEGKLDYSRWSPRFRDILKIAAEVPEVERIFVNPVIKQALCRKERDRAWLRKIRPWWGHDSHFHVRLRCPLGNDQCKKQQSPPPGDGCDGALDKWVKELQQVASTPKPKRQKFFQKPVKLPVICAQVLEEM